MSFALKLALILTLRSKVFRKLYRQPTMWVATTDLPAVASHPFYQRLNKLLREHGFDDFVEAECANPAS